MSWKKSKDGGMDYDPTLDTKYKQAKEKMFNPASSAMTMTFNTNIEELPLPKPTVKQRFDKYKKRRGLA